MQIQPVSSGDSIHYLPDMHSESKHTPPNKAARPPLLTERCGPSAGESHLSRSPNIYSWLSLSEHHLKCMQQSISGEVSNETLFSILLSGGDFFVSLLHGKKEPA